MKYRLIPLAISIVLAIIPFFWLKPGWMDLGGDSSRLYFYDPLNYLRSFPLYSLAPDGFAGENISYYLIPFVSLLLVFKKILISSYLLITLFNSMQLVVAFLSVYTITIEFFQETFESSKERMSIYLAAVTAGLFYTFSPFLTPNGWDKAMFIHNQFFLNPLVFLLLLKYIHTKTMQYLLLTLLVTFIFAPNFKQPLPAFFAFYPLAIAYLVLYAKLIKKTPLGIKKLFLAFMLFLGIHLFHLLPQILAFFQGNEFYQATFSQLGKFDRGLGYFTAVAQTTKFVNNLISLPQGESSIITLFEIFWFIFPTLTITGLLLNGKINETVSIRSKNILLLGLFFLCTLFLVTANVTNIGFAFYKDLFIFPGFSIFRNYVGQFSFIFIFFYALLLGQSLVVIFSRITKQKTFFLIILLMSLIIISSIPFIKGDMTNLVINKMTEFNFSKPKEEVHVPIKIDPNYEEALTYIRKNPIDGKYLTLPFTEAGLQMVGGLEGGAYQGPSTIAYLTGKKDFSGYQVMLPFSDTFLQMVKEKDYEGINHLLSLLNIKYIFYNSDSYIYIDNFPGVPYSKTYGFMPESQTLYKDFIEHLAVKKKVDFGDKYHIYELNDTLYLPHIFVAKKTAYINENKLLFSPFLRQDDPRIAWILDRNVAIQDRAFIDEIYLAPHKESEFFDYFAKKETTQIIASKVSNEQYILIQPLVLLQQKLLRNASDITTLPLLMGDTAEPRNLEYTITPPLGGSFDGYVSKTISKEGITLKTENKLFKRSDKGDADDFIRFDAVELDEKENKLTLTIPQKTILTSQVRKLVFSEDTPSTSFITSETVFLILTTILRQYTTVLPNTTYIISFEYLFPQNGSLWKSYEAIFELNSDGNKGFLKVLTPKDTVKDPAIDPSTMPYSIRSVLVEKIDDPTFLLKQTIHESSKDNTRQSPQITFTKINPTRYMIEVKNASNPYTLAFLDKFNPNWQLFLLHKNIETSENAASYFHGEMTEKTTKNIFLDRNSFETWRKTSLANMQHFQINGYANGWYIKPEDTNGEKDYTLVLELTSQRLFYLFFGLSLITVTVCLIWLVMLLSKASKRDLKE